MTAPRRNVAYGFSQPLINEAPVPVVALRDPATTDIGYQLGTEWINKSTSNIWFLASVVANSATWLELTVGGGTGVFSSLTVTPGPISLTGTTTINTTGAAATTIGTGGTGLVAIGNTTGNTSVTGTLTTSGALTVTAGGAAITGTTGINTAGAAVTTIGTGGTGATNIGNATGNTAVTGSLGTTTTLTAGTTVTATLGNITATNGDFVASTAAKGIILGGGAKVVSGTGDPNTAVTAPQGSLYLRLDGSSVATRAYINTNGGTAWAAVTTAS